jgi:hypothetical protein
VKSHIAAVESSLRTRLPDSAHVPTTAGLGVPAWAQYFAQEPAALRRVLHHLRRNFTPFHPGSLEWCQGGKQAVSRCLRVPQIPGARPAESLNAWISFLASQLDPGVPYLGVVPNGQAWMDVIVGEPGPADFFLLRARPAELPLVSEIPYELEAETPAEQALFASLARGQLPDVSCLNGRPVAANREAAAKWLLRFRPGSRPGFLFRLFGIGGS